MVLSFGEAGVIPARARRRDAQNMLSLLPEMPQFWGHKPLGKPEKAEELSALKSKYPSIKTLCKIKVASADSKKGINF